MKKLFKIDASLLSEANCLRRVDYIHNIGLTTTLGTYKMDYGTAFHKFRASYRKGNPQESALREALNWFLPKCLGVPIEDFRTIDHLAEVCKAYAKYYPLMSDILQPLIINGKKALELNFSLPYLSTPECDVMIEGTLDEGGTFDGRKCIADCKVTALWSQEDFLKSFELVPQLRLYSWVYKNYIGTDGYYPPAMIDGIFIRKPTEKSKNKVTGKLEVNKEWNGVSFNRSALIEFSDSSMVEFEEWLRDKVMNIIKSHLSGKWKPEFNCCSGKYGLCDFFNLCKYGDTTEARSFYGRRVYDPQAHQS